MTTQSHALPLPGLDAQDPLAYLAALGCLLAATSQCQREGLPSPTLCFDLAGVPIPTLHGPWSSLDALARALMADLDEIAGRGPSGAARDRFLAFTYPDDKGNAVRDLKPPPKDFRILAETLIDAACPEDRRTADWASATLTDVATDGSKNAKPFALHFTAGQQRFLVVALELLDGADEKARPGSPKRPVDADDLRVALAGPWPHDRALKVFSWSPAQDRAYALRAVDPSNDQKLGTPGADWLALRGIGMLCSAPVGTQTHPEIHTSGVHGRWKTGTFSYPLWSLPMDADAARSLLRHPAVRPPRARDLEDGLARTLPRGVEVLTCRISRSDQGGYGAFSHPLRR
ncbi:type I-G CRISPR-associated protein, Cas3-extension family [Paraliomyxa miuraensis]|uniref:type I-G CRISPR-associated protein, Cas3-extension family n=1 Tax=Paraliomyxa miuraensis TaxID=376150 RepID=UPI00224EEE4D|nr:hypothetical protein [Paraliomyxa miuraensis]MCX4242535.1 hypothetical protein [Paraliomyxa miuraensis]